ncbi:MAG: hypothetical protein LBD18_06640 [Treponema sp.]|jgi:hypothetical protein|nr:hypothetical protein [Treponema sp.]
MKERNNPDSRINIIIALVFILLVCLLSGCRRRERKLDAAKVPFPDTITTGAELVNALDSVIDVVPGLIRQSNNGDAESGKKIDQIVDVLSRVDYEHLDLTASQKLGLVSMSGKALPILKEIMSDSMLSGLLSMF